MVTIRHTLSMAVAVGATLAASAQSWYVHKYAEQSDDYWVAACQVRLGAGDEGYAQNGDLALRTSTETVNARYNRGEEDVLRPVLFVNGNVLQGPSREIAPGTSIGSLCDEPRDGGAASYAQCASVDREHRFRYRLSTSDRAEEGWAQPTAFRVHTNGVPDSDTAAYAIWTDFPDSLFETDDRRSIRFEFSGLDRGTDRYSDLRHWTRIRVGFEYGLEARRELDRCVQDHVRAGRLTVPVDDDTLEAARAAFIRQFR